MTRCQQFVVGHVFSGNSMQNANDAKRLRTVANDRVLSFSLPGFREKANNMCSSNITHLYLIVKYIYH